MPARSERSEAPLLVRYLDLLVLLAALPVFLAAEAPLLGWASTSVAWIAQRALQGYLAGRMKRTEDVHEFFRFMAGSLIGRSGLVVTGIFVAGIIERPAGLAAALLALAVFTTYLVVSILNRPAQSTGMESKTE